MRRGQGSARTERSSDKKHHHAHGTKTPGLLRAGYPRRGDAVVPYHRFSAPVRRTPATEFEENSIEYTTFHLPITGTLAQLLGVVAVTAESCNAGAARLMEMVLHRALLQLTVHVVRVSQKHNNSCAAVLGVCGIQGPTSSKDHGNLSLTSTHKLCGYLGNLGRLPAMAIRPARLLSVSHLPAQEQSSTAAIWCSCLQSTSS
ncbi:hypothetical protein EJ03DRAFT_328775 [Teratosphaeria nubilosa]|uniref:Uncharacterized protein n=1 Tax=Teratosphaeria nubilosa TaxID=161662 RepID=A0A6G1L4Y5_9PEZI|nr:hypothetical protein EJ03DRAFT_328775 [Teratosphaeria nubilosa]